jgi:kynurenine formamidase
VTEWYPSRYGAADRAGAGNELNPERTLRALRIPRSGRVIELAQPTRSTTPVVAPRVHHQLILAHESGSGPENWRGANGFTALQEHVATSYHVGCHLDALGHVGIRGRFYNGLTHREVFAPSGLDQLGIDQARPWLCRGVILDLTADLDSDPLDAGHEITAQELANSAARAGITIEAGDAVLVHTGWSALAEQDRQRYAIGEPGLGAESARWLADRRVSLVGVDNWGCDVHPNPRADQFFPAHQELLTRTGTYILENIRTADLVRSGRCEFLFVLGVPKLDGATAAVVAPLAVL